MKTGVKKKILLIDNNIDQPWPMGDNFRRYLSSGDLISVRRGPQKDIPKDIESFSHIILSGSKTSCLDRSDWVLNLEELLRNAAELEKHVLGVCFGHQIIARTFSGIENVRKAISPEYGWVKIRQTAKHRLFDSIPDEFHTYQSHNEEVVALLPEFEITAQSENCAIQAFQHRSKPIYGIQFHPEKNAAEGEASIAEKIKDKTIARDCIFNPGRANSLHSESIAQVIFKNFLENK